MFYHLLHQVVIARIGFTLSQEWKRRHANLSIDKLFTANDIPIDGSIGSMPHTTLFLSIAHFIALDKTHKYNLVRKKRNDVIPLL